MPVAADGGLTLDCTDGAMESAGIAESRKFSSESRRNARELQC